MAAISQSTSAQVSPVPSAAAAVQQQTPRTEDDFASMIAPAAPSSAATATQGNIAIKPGTIADTTALDQSTLQDNPLPGQTATASLSINSSDLVSVTASMPQPPAMAPTSLVASATPSETAAANTQPTPAPIAGVSTERLTGQIPPARIDEAPAPPAEAPQAAVTTPRAIPAEMVPTQPAAQQPIPARNDPKQAGTVATSVEPATNQMPIVGTAKQEPSQAVQNSTAKLNHRGDEKDPPQVDGLSWSLTCATTAPGVAVAANAGTPVSTGSQSDSAKPQPDNGRSAGDVPGLVAVMAGAPADRTQTGSMPDDRSSTDSGGPDTAASSASVASSQSSAVVNPVHTDPPMAKPAGSAGEQVAVHIAKALQDGSKTITVELHPAELGRVEIRLSFQSDGLSVRMTVDRQETFDSFSRDHAALEQQLGQAGVDLGAGGLDLRLGQQSGQSESDTSGGRSRSVGPVTTSPVRLTTLWVGHGLVDILA